MGWGKVRTIEWRPEMGKKEQIRWGPEGEVGGWVFILRARRTQ